MKQMMQQNGKLKQKHQQMLKKTRWIQKFATTFKSKEKTNLIAIR